MSPEDTRNSPTPASLTGAPTPPPSAEVASTGEGTLRERILAFDDQQFEDVEVPEWQTTVRVRGLTGAERDAWEGSLMRQEGRRARVDYSNVRAKLIVRCVVDRDGNRIFEDRDEPALGRKSASALQRIFEVAQRLSRLTDEDVEELTGNSSGGPSAENGSGSPHTFASP